MTRKLDGGVQLQSYIKRVGKGGLGGSVLLFAVLRVEQLHIPLTRWDFGVGPKLVRRFTGLFGQ